MQKHWQFSGSTIQMLQMIYKLREIYWNCKRYYASNWITLLMYRFTNAENKELSMGTILNRYEDFKEILHHLLETLAYKFVLIHAQGPIRAYCPFMTLYGLILFIADVLHWYWGARSRQMEANLFSFFTIQMDVTIQRTFTWLWEVFFSNYSIYIYYTFFFFVTPNVERINKISSVIKII